jgi:hypothetical protein
MKVYFWFKKRASIPLAPCMAPDPESQTNADPREYKSLQETDADAARNRGADTDVTKFILPHE